MDQTFSLLNDPYRFISKECKKKNTDAFVTRLLLRKTVCMTGKLAAEEVFSNTDLIIRKNSAPNMLTSTLQVKKGVTDMDGDAHRHRKDMFMSIMTPENVRNLGRIVTEKWSEKIPVWAGKENIQLYEELQFILAESVFIWAGVPVKQNEIKLRTKELAALFDKAGSKGLGHIWSRIARKHSNSWMRGIVRELRKNSSQIITPAQIICFHRDLNGKLLDTHTAAIEVLNILRPVVAISLYMVFAAHALELHPESRERLKNNEEGYLDHFINEVRRLYPFMPAMMGKVAKDFTWHGVKFKKGWRVMMDNWGTNHDPKEWTAPMEFNPDRYKTKNATPFNFIPQGAGNHFVHHRCPGEFITLELMQVALEFLVLKLDYKVPEQNLKIDFKRTPALPKDHFLLRQVRWKDNISEVQESSLFKAATLESIQIFPNHKHAASVENFH